MANRAQQGKVNIPICLAGVLLCLTLFSMHFTGGLFARYVSRDSGSDSARVIQFGDLTLTETPNLDKWLITPGVDMTKDATVTFAGSESATYVFAQITLTGNWTVEGNQFAIRDGGNALLSWAVADGWTPVEGTTYVYYRELAPNVPLTADIVAENGKIAVSKSITRTQLKDMTGISIEFSAAVVQSGGFADAKAAWASVSAH